MVTVADISKEAFDAVAAELGGVVHDATLTYDVLGEHNPTTGVAVATPTTATGRAVFGTAAAIASRFPAYVIGPDDLLIMLEGFTTVPRVGWRVTINSIERTIKAVGDIAGAGDFFEVIAA